MVARILAIANLKGGVGKSTSVLMMADRLAILGYKILVLDLDPQANISYMMLGRRSIEKYAAEAKTLTQYLNDAFIHGQEGVLGSYIIREASDLEEQRKPGAGRVDLFAATPRLRFVELAAEERFAQEKGSLQAAERGFEVKLREIARHFTEYDVVMFDCPPGFTSLCRAALRVADCVISPTVPDYISILGLRDFASFGLRMARDGVDRPLKHGALLTKVEARREDMRGEIEALKADRRFRLFTTQVRQSRDAVRASERIRPDVMRNFNEKYGGLKDSVRKLGDETAAFLNLGSDKNSAD
jgi:chromosome partitioning protein